MSILNVSDEERKLRAEIAGLKADQRENLKIQVEMQDDINELAAKYERFRQAYSALVIERYELLSKLAEPDPAINEMQEVADRYAHRLALELECVLADRPGYYDKAMQVLCEYRSAMNAIHERESPTFMGEPALNDRPCNPHPDAPHGFSRNASHAAGRDVCDCEGWTP